MFDNVNPAPQGDLEPGNAEKAPSTARPSTEVRDNVTSTATPNVTQPSGTAAYDLDLALLAEQKEKDMSFKDAAKGDLRLIMYSLGYSGTIIMEGYGLALLTYLFSVQTFNKTYGTAVDGTDQYEVCCDVRYNSGWSHLF